MVLILHENKIFYFPNYKLILFDLVGLFLSYVIVIGITPTHAENPWAKYLPIIGIYAFLGFSLAIYLGGM